MKNPRRSVGGARGVLLAMLLTSCSQGGGGEWTVPDQGAEKTGSHLHITGVVRHFDLEGGFYAIRGDDGVTYDPTNLPPDFQKDGLAVEADARKRTDLLGVHQVGPIVELDRIRAR